MRMWDRLTGYFTAVDTQVEIFCLVSRLKEIPHLPNQGETRDILLSIEVEDRIDVSLRDD
jgi:hypothetical protein